MIVDLGSNKGVSNEKHYSKLTDIQNLLSMSIFDTPEKDVSNSGKITTGKVYTSYVDSSSVLFSC